MDTWKAPILIVHGDDDRSADVEQSTRLVTALRKRGIEPEQLVLPDEDHDFLTYGNLFRVYRAVADFFARKLGAP
jgi:dipeptidyl aminopeptidase/acylaminoacyl peptidase